jgi:hypothetical protein
LPVSVGRIAALLQLLFALLLFLQISLRGSALRKAGAEDSRGGWRRLRRWFVGVGIVVVAAGWVVRGGRLRLAGMANAELNLPGRSLALVANHEYVVAGALKKLR